MDFAFAPSFVIGRFLSSSLQQILTFVTDLAAVFRESVNVTTASLSRHVW
jgi:hypothetical protein